MPMTPLAAAPSRADPANFSARADALLTALPNFVTEANALETNVNAKEASATTQAGNAATSAATASTQAGNAAASATTATTAASTATTQAALATTNGAAQVALATTQANNAAASAASAAALAGAFVGTSTSSLAIGTGSKTFATQANEQYTVGVFLSAVSAANTANFMYGQVTSYNAATGALVLDVQVTGGSGTAAHWNISLVGPRGPEGPPGAGLTAQAVGFTATAGTTAKTLTVDADIKTSDIVEGKYAGANLHTFFNFK